MRYNSFAENRILNIISKKRGLGNRSMANKVCYTTVNVEENGQRLDNYLIRILKGVPRSYIYRIIRGGEVRVNKKRAKVSQRLITGDVVRIPPVRMREKGEAPVVSSALFERLERSIIFEDTRLLVLNKPQGMAVHGGSGLQFGVIEAFRAMRPDAPYLELVHRLDRETSGCLLIAKKRSMLRQIQALFEARKVQKTYWLLAHNAWHPSEHRRGMVRIDAPLQKNILRSGERMVHVSDMGKPSETLFKCLENYNHTCWLEARPKTGRTHQIRVHAAFLGHPIIGDEKYGQSEQDLAIKQHITQRLYLHAHAIQFTLDNKPYCFEAVLGGSFDDAIQLFQKSN